MKNFSLRQLGAAAISFAMACFGAMPAFSQAMPDAAPAYTQEQLEKLVGPIALYPDDLLAITLPSATYPLDLVKAQRFLEKLKKDPKAQPDPSLPDSVLKLLNYPDVVKMMNDDLDWTEALGEAVDTDEAGVMNAVQSFRRKAEGAGNLKSNDKQVVVVEKETIVIKPANPEVIYVPQYQPSQVIVYSPTPYAWGYYPTPYPSYYYPYAPGAAFATGLIWGAAIGGAWGMGWNNGHIENNINVNRNTNINTGNRNNINAGNRPSQGGGQNWRNDRAPTQTKAGAQARQGSVGSRPGDARAGGGGASARPASTGAASSRASPSASNYGGSRQSGSASAMQNRSASSGGGGAFSGAGSSGARTNQASSRGASSMSSPSARSASASRPSGGGGARGGGGGARGGGGGRR
jgi:hypothetical protein